MPSMRSKLSLSHQWWLFFAVPVLLAGCAGGFEACVRPVCPGPDGCGRVAIRASENLATGIRRAPEISLDTLPLTPVPRSHPKVGRLRGRGSLSIGTATHGFVVEDARLPLEGPHHRVLAVQAARGLNCGTDELVSGILRAAKLVARKHPGAILPVANMGRCGGGDICWSVSHNSGRDVDLGFYLVGPDGSQHVPDQLVVVGRDGTGMEGETPLRFDTARNWQVVRALLTDPNVSIQWMFVSRDLRKRLLDHAEATGESANLVARAAEVMAQPGRSRPHNDHFHVRIYCPKDDLFEGCRDSGSNRSWYRGDGGRAIRRAAELVRLSRSQVPEVRAAAATVLGRMGRASAGPLLLRLLSDPDRTVVLSAARALGELGVWSIRDRVVRQIAVHPDDVVAGLLFEALGTLPLRAWLQALGELLAVERPLVADMGVFRITEPARDRALDRLCLAGRSRATTPLIKALARPEVDIAAIDERLRELTGADPGETATGDPFGAWSAWANGQANP